MQHRMAEYDSIADAYRDSKLLPFREVIERYTLFEVLGDIRGQQVLDMACGDGFYTRLLKQAGASDVMGIDVSAEMIRLAERAETRHPLGCTYLHRDVAKFEPSGTVDVVVAMYLLNHARTAEQLFQFCQVCRNALRPGGRFIGFNENVWNPPDGTVSWEEYGIKKTCRPRPEEGDAILYRTTNSDGRQFEFKNFYFSLETYQDAFRHAGFRDFRWLEVSVLPTERHNPFWAKFVRDPPVIPFASSR